MTGSRQVKWARRRSRSEWRSLLAKCGGSGLGIEAFCRREGISAASFYRWRHILCDTIDRGDVVVRDSAAAFVDLGALNSQSPKPRLDLKLELGDGLVVHLVRS